VQHVLRDFAAPPTQSADSNSTKTKNAPAASCDRSEAAEDTRPRQEPRPAKHQMTALHARTTATTTLLSTRHTYHHHNAPPNSAKQPPYITKPKHDKHRTSNLLPFCHCHASTEAYCSALRRVSRKSRRRFIISSSPELHALLRAALMMRYALTLSLPPPFVIQEPVRARIVRGSSAARATAE
jgi:hypothetical protein